MITIFKYLLIILVAFYVAYVLAIGYISYVSIDRTIVQVEKVMKLLEVKNE